MFNKRLSVLIKPQLSLMEKKALLLFQNEMFIDSKWSDERLDMFLNEEERTPIYIRLEIKNALAGFVLGRKELKNKKSFILELIAVAPLYSGMGLGKELVNSFIKTVFEKTEANKIILHYRDGKNLESFYAKMGFGNNKIVGEYKNKELKNYMEILKDGIIQY
jgi:ribosomal protein S18 acetylase RimI-like enzyme